MGFDIIVAATCAGGIGINGTLPWKLSGDMKYFKQITTRKPNTVVIMGRLTWESLPIKHRPLPNRINIVVSSKNISGCLVCTSFDDALITAEKYGSSIFCIGGSQLFKAAFAHPDLEKIYLTRVMRPTPILVTSFMPSIPRNFNLVNTSHEIIKENECEYEFLLFEKL